MKQSEAKKKKKKRMLIATLGVAAIIIGGLTFAWYTSKDSVTNTFKTGGNLKTVVVENFTPPTNWQPGVTTDKVVQVTNTGTVDAYTRIRLDEYLTYYEKSSTATELTAEALSGENFAYFTVDAEAIEKTVANWNAEHTYADDSEETGYVLLKDSDLSALADTINPNAVIYVKKTYAESLDSDKATTEDGFRYEFLGYYDTGKTIDNSNNVVGSGETAVTSGKKLAYELVIEPTIVDTQTVNAADEDTGKTSITHDYSDSTLKLSVYGATKKTITGNSSTTASENIDQYIELEFNKDSNWYFSNGYYYYMKVLPSGGSTDPLLKAVKFRDNVGNELSNATYSLTVVSDSTQATTDAAVTTWSLGTGDNAAFDTIFGSSATTNIKVTTATAHTAIEDNVCSDDLEREGLAGFAESRKHEDTVAISDKR
jgi:alternate signal-mediated exported protein